MIAGLAESLLNFRGPLLVALQGRGFEVHVAAPDMPEGSQLHRRLSEMGLQVHRIPLARAGTDPLKDLATLLQLWRLMRHVRPSYVLGYTIKPVIYGSLAGWLAGVPHRFALITGLGYAFQGEGERGRLQALVQRLYALALARVHVVFFQNPDDHALFVQRRILGPNARSQVVNGSGVDLAMFPPVPLPEGPPRFLMIARLLGDKGVREYAKAAECLGASHPDVSFSLVGWIDDNPDSIAQSELDAWVARGALDFKGRLDDVRPALADCNVFVLPSYREGTPRTVLEAMAMGRPIITTDAPGCRQTVADSENGFLVPVKSAAALQTAMKRFIDDPGLIARMGARSRQIAANRFDVNKVNAALMSGMGL